MDELRKIPPVTRTLLAATGAITLPCLLALMTPFRFALIWPLVLRRYELYRIFTSFFYGGNGLPFLFDAFLLFRNSSELELNHFARRTSAYVWSLLITMLSILALNYPLQSPILFSPLLNALTYIWARSNPTGKVSFFGFITVPAPWLPYAYLFLDLVRGGPALMIQSATGVVSGHVYWLLAEVWPATNGGRGPRLAETPAWLQRLLPDSQDPSLAGQAMGDRGARRFAGGTAWNAAPGQRLGDRSARQQTTGAIASIRSALPSAPGWSSLTGLFGRGDTAATGSNRGPDREALLAAAERRLRAQHANSIVGRNASASSTALSASPVRPAGGSANLAPSLSSSVNARASNPSATSAVRRTAATSGQSNVVGFGQFRSSAGVKKSEAEEEEEGEEDPSSSGGRVAEKRWKAPKREEASEDEAESRANEGQRGTDGHGWGGQGRRLGE